jgi:threonine/homoserine/homoserine lactone efflux protein
LIRRARSPQRLPAPTSRRSGTGAFLGGFLLTLGDLKAILFYGSLLRVFFDLGDPGVWEVAGIVGATLIGVGGVKLAYALLAHRLQSRFAERSLGRRSQAVAGGLLVGAGSWVIVRP